MIEIRAIEKSDIEAVVQLNVMVWQTAYKGIINQEFLDSRIQGVDEAIKRQKENFNPHSFVAIFNDEIVGYAAYGKERTGKENTCEVYAIYIKEKMQGQGIGRMLINKCKERLSTYKYMHIWALKDNPNKSFYTKLGGKKVDDKILTIGHQSLETECFEYVLKG